MSYLPSLSQHLMASAGALLIYVLTTRVGRARRPPTSAIAWVMGLALIPYLSLPLFLLFGRRKIRAPRRPRSAPVEEGAHWAQALIAAFGLPAASAARVRFHADGLEAREALWELIESAQRTLDVSTFLIGNDELGCDALARLARRARAGIKVRLMIDAAGALIQRPPALRELKAAGGQVAFFNRFLAFSRKTPRNLRNHRKLAIADGAWLWSGGRNLAAQYFTGHSGERPWIDLSFDVLGPAAGSAAGQFALDWQVASGAAAAAITCDAGPPGARPAQFIPSGPDQSEDTVHTLLLAACFHARERILAVTPYFVPDDALLEALRMAVLRGVKLSLILPSCSNHRLADFVRGRALRTLTQAGAQIRLVPQMVHAKAVIVDDSLALSGSVNLDSRSLLINFESVVAFYGQEEIRWLAEWLQALAADSEAYAARPAGLLRDLTEGLLLTIAFQI